MIAGNRALGERRRTVNPATRVPARWAVPRPQVRAVGRVKALGDDVFGAGGDGGGEEGTASAKDAFGQGHFLYGQPIVQMLILARKSHA